MEVRYLMRNETDKRVKVRFGFPVEELLDNAMAEGGYADSGQSERGNGKLKYCQNYRIIAGGKALTAEWQGEEKAAEDKRFRGIAG